jgi:hypothetical protein
MKNSGGFSGVNNPAKTISAGPMNPPKRFPGSLTQLKLNIVDFFGEY